MIPNPSLVQPLQGTTSPDFDNSHVPHGQHHVSVASSIKPSPSPGSALRRDENHTSLYHRHPNLDSAVSTSSTDSFSTFKSPPDGPYSYDVRNLSHEINTRSDLQILPKIRDTECDRMPERDYPEQEGQTANNSNSPSPRHQGSKTALHIAAAKGKTSTVRFLLSLQPDIDTLAQDDEGRTALHIAVINKQQGVIIELAKNPICLDVTDREGQTALHVAAALGHERAVGCLVSAGADLECKDVDGRTAFHLAAANGRDGILQLLYREGANINARTEI